MVAVYGSLHLGQLQVGLSCGIRLCQSREIEIVLKSTIPLQIDGEPVLQNPCTIKVSFFKQSFMLCKSLAEGDVVTTKVNAVLDWAESTEVITWIQRDIFSKEISRQVKGSTSRLNLSLLGKVDK